MLILIIALFMVPVVVLGFQWLLRGYPFSPPCYAKDSCDCPWWRR